MTDKNHSKKESTTSLVFLSVVVVVFLAGIFGYAVVLQKRSLSKRETVSSKVQIGHEKRVSDQLLEETADRVLQAEIRLADLTLENVMLKSELADRKDALNKGRV